MAEDEAVRALRARELFYTPRVGRLVAVDPDGRPSVVFEGSHGVAVLARSVVSLPMPAAEADESVLDAEVLLAFELGDPARPILMGFLSESLRPQPAAPEAQLALGTLDRDVVVDGRRVVLEGRDEVVLRCGESSIHLRSDGRVVVRGTSLLSRSSGPNKIKGGSVDIN